MFERREKNLTPAKIRNTDLLDGSLVSTATQLSQLPLKGRSIAEVTECWRRHVMTAMSTLETEALEVVWTNWSSDVSCTWRCGLCSTFPCRLSSSEQDAMVYTPTWFSSTPDLHFEILSPTTGWRRTWRSWQSKGLYEKSLR